MISFANIPKNNTRVVAFGTKDLGPYYWVGNCENGINHYAGQSFQAPATGLLKRIQLFSAIVHCPSSVTLSIFQFDNTTNTFQTKLTEATTDITREDESKWVDFTISNLRVAKNQYYAFKINCNGTGMFAIAECPWSTTNPYIEGIQWTGSSTIPDGVFHKDFDFAFEGFIEASSDAKFI